MTPASLDEGNYDVQFSIRVPKALADEINTRAEREGIKPSTWIRNAITYTIEDKDKTRADDIRTPLLRILQQDEAVRAIIREIILAEQKPVRNIKAVKEELADIQKDKRKLEHTLQNSQESLRLIERNLAEQERAITHLEAQQKKLLATFVQDPSNRETLTHLDELAAKLSAEKEKCESLRNQRTEARKEYIIQETMLVEQNAKYMQLREELTAQNETERREYFSQINKKMRDNMK